MFCKACGKELPDDSIFCTECGTSIEKTDDNTVNQTSFVGNTIKKKLKLRGYIEQLNPWIKRGIAVVFILFAVFFVFKGIGEVTSDDYSFYTEHYNECMEGYEDCTREADFAGYMLRGSYERLAEDWKDMANEDLRDIWKMRISAIIYVVIAIICILSGLYVLSCKSTVHKISTVPITKEVEDCISIDSLNMQKEEKTEDEKITE